MAQKKETQQTDSNSEVPVTASAEAVEYIARKCHAANLAYCESIGDHSQVPWEDAPEWQKNSAIDGVKFRIENPTVTPEQMHENWMKVKIADGWKFGEVKDVEAKTHPCIVPYAELPEAQQTKDQIFLATFEKAAIEFFHSQLPGVRPLDRVDAVIPVSDDNQNALTNMPPAFEYKDVHGREWSFYKEEDKWQGFAVSETPDEMAGVFHGALDDWTEETIREYVDANPKLTETDKLPATGENPDDRLDRGNDGPVVTDEDPEDAEAASCPTNVVKLDFNSARHRGAEIGQWCHVNAVKHMPDNYERKYELIVPEGVELPDFIKALVIS